MAQMARLTDSCEFILGENKHDTDLHGNSQNLFGTPSYRLRNSHSAKETIG